MAAPLFPSSLRNRSIENRSNDNRFRINWSHSVKLTGYVFLRSPPRPTVDFHSSNSSISTSALPPLIPSPSTPSRPGHETRLPSSSLAPCVAPRILYPQTFSRDSPSSFIFPFMPPAVPERSNRRLFVFHQANTILSYSSFDSLLFNFH